MARDFTKSIAMDHLNLAENCQEEFRTELYHTKLFELERTIFKFLNWSNRSNQEQDPIRRDIKIMKQPRAKTISSYSRKANMYIKINWQNRQPPGQRKSVGVYYRCYCHNHHYNLCPVHKSFCLERMESTHIYVYMHMCVCIRSMSR